MGRTRKKVQEPAQSRPLRVLQYAVIALSFFGIAHFNLVLEYAPKWWYRGKAPHQKLYGELTNLCRVMGFASIWKMYSPPPRFVHIYEWWEPSGDSWKRIPGPPSLSARHRKERSLMDALLFDTKRGRVLDNYFHYFKYYDRRLPVAYAKYWKKRLETQLGRPIPKIRVIVKRRRIPEMNAPEPWPPPASTFKEVWLDQVYP